MLTIYEPTTPKSRLALPHPSTLLYWRPMIDHHGFFVQSDQEFEEELCEPADNFPTL